MATPENPAALTVPTQQPGSLSVGTKSLADLTVGTEPLPPPVQPLSPGSLVAQPESPGERVGKPWNLEDLPNAAPVESNVRREVAAEVAARQPPIPTPDSLVAAQSQLAAAQARLDRIDSAIGTMIARDYPTGEARLRLYDEQAQSRTALEEAKRQVERFGGSGPSAD